MQLHTSLSILAMDLFDLYLALQANALSMRSNLLYIEEVGKGTITSPIVVLLFRKQARLTPSSRRFLMEADLAEVAMSKVAEAKSSSDWQSSSKHSEDVAMMLWWNCGKDKDERYYAGCSKRML